MQDYSSDQFEKEFEEILMSTYPTDNVVNNSTLAEPQPVIRNPGVMSPKKAVRAQSLYSFGNNLLQRQDFLTTLMPRPPESANSLSIIINPFSVTLPKGNRATKKLMTLNTMLLDALRYREVEAIEKFILAGANPNATCCIESISACHLAAARPDGALAMLLSHGAERNRSDKTGRTPLHLAVWAGNIRQASMLLRFSTDLIKKVTGSTITPAIEEEIRNASAFLKDVVNAKCRMSKQQATIPEEWMDNMIEHNCKEFEKSLPLFQPGWTPLHAASSRAKSQCVRLLIAAGADPNIRDLVGRTPLDIVGCTFYSDDYIDPDSFTETVIVLIDGKGSFSIRNRKTFDTPLHTAVELNSIEAVIALMSIKVPVSWQNRAGLTPVHLCVKHRLREMLQVLLNDRPEIEDDTNFVSPLEVRNREGHTVLHTAVLDGWEHGVSIAIESGANLIAKDNNRETSLHLAAAAGDIDILNKILYVAKHADIIDEPNAQGETPLIKAVSNGHTECVKRLLEENASVKVTIQHEKNVFHIAAEQGMTEVLQILLDNDYIITRGMINYLADDKTGFGPIHYAVQNNHPQCVKLLLSRNAFRGLKSSLTGIYIGATPLHIAAIHNNVEIAKILVKNNPDIINSTNSLDWTPLHTACSYGSRDMIVLLLKEGADLSGIAFGTDGKTETTAMELLMNSLSKPTEFLYNIFDSCISTNQCDIQDPNCEVMIDYRVLVPTAEGREQMKVIEALVKTGDRFGQTRLLVHPLIESLLHLKWKALLPFFYTMILTYGIYVMVVTFYVMVMFTYKDMDIKRPKWIQPEGMASLVYVSSLFVVVLEALYVNINARYFMQFETWVKFGAMVLALNLPNAISTLDGELYEYTRHLATMALLMSWLEMLFLVSRFPSLGFYVLMFGKVSCNVLKILITFSFLLIGFALAFMVQFHHESPFEDPWAAFVKTFVMMTSEFDYGNLIEAKNAENVTVTTFNKLVPPIEVFRFTFVGFVILSSIVLMNLMVGVAVNDLHDLQVLGNVRRLTKQVEFLVSLDTLLYNRYFRQYIPKRLAEIILKKKTILSVVNIRPSDGTSKFYKALPKDIRNTIFEKAQSRKKMMEDELGTENYKKKLSEIYDAIVRKKIVQQERSRVVNKPNNNDERGENLFENMSQKIVDLDSGIIDNNKQTSETLNELRNAVKQLEIKIEMIFNTLQGYQSTQGRSYFKTLRDKS